MFHKILIANRGEVACRIIRTCQAMGIRTAAVFSEADRGALHVRMADEAYYLGPAPPLDSYLNVVKIIETARQAEAEAIHPGYGFLSQNASFVVACQEAGIKFIGPTVEVMAQMGDKLLAREIAEKAGLPVLPGTNTEVTNRQALKRAKKLGFPLMVKAAAGGGGIGMHIVHSSEELKPIIDRERRLAENAFGSPRLYFERYLEHASHIEVQVLGDEHGKVIHLFERDCSVQRRNQKILEVSPSMKLDSKQRKNLTKYALKLAKSIGYTNAGTVEFLVSTDGDIYFLEMNTRLQVEHGITEMVTGLDLVELQIRVAAGEALPIKQKDVQRNGYAMEARINAEDPETFLPNPGTITGLTEPHGEFIRVDSCIFPGYEVSTHYDSLLAKVMCWGATREEARERLSGALNEFVIEGVKTNIPFLRRVVSHEDFVAGTYDTWLVSHIMTSPQEGFAAPDEGGDRGDRALAAAIAVALVASPREPAPALKNDGHGVSPWRWHGRSQQMSSRVMGRRSWR